MSRTPWVKWSGSQADHPPLSSAKVKNEYSHTPTPAQPQGI